MARRYSVREGVTELIVRPGEPLPVGRLVTAWKLDAGQYGPSAICIHYTDLEDGEEHDAERED